MSFKDIARNDYDRVLKFSLFKVPKRGKRTFLGEAQFSLNNIKKKKKKMFHVYHDTDLVGQVDVIDI